MPYNYTIDNTGAKSVLTKHQTMKSCDSNVDGAGRQHKTTTICDTSWNSMPKEKLHIRLSQVSIGRMDD
jgi:hypothetical protein